MFNLEVLKHLLRQAWSSHWLARINKKKIWLL